MVILFTCLVIVYLAVCKCVCYFCVFLLLQRERGGGLIRSPLYQINLVKWTRPNNLRGTQLPSVRNWFFRLPSVPLSPCLSVKQPFPNHASMIAQFSMYTVPLVGGLNYPTAMNASKHNTSRLKKLTFFAQVGRVVSDCSSCQIGGTDVAISSLSPRLPLLLPTCISLTFYPVFIKYFH